MPKVSPVIPSHDRIVVAIGIQVLIVVGTAGRECRYSRGICADKPTPLGAVIPGVQIVEPRLVVVVVPTVAERVLRAHAVIGGVGHRAVAPGVVAVRRHDLPAAVVHQPHHVAQQIVQVVVQPPVERHGHPEARAVVVEPQLVVPRLLHQDLAALEEVIRGGPVHRLGDPLPISVVGVGDGIFAIIITFLQATCNINNTGELTSRSALLLSVNPSRSGPPRGG